MSNCPCLFRRISAFLLCGNQLLGETYEWAEMTLRENNTKPSFIYFSLPVRTDVHRVRGGEPLFDDSTSDSDALLDDPKLQTDDRNLQSAPTGDGDDPPMACNLDLSSSTAQASGYFGDVSEVTVSISGHPNCAHSLVYFGVFFTGCVHFKWEWNRGAG